MINASLLLSIYDLVETGALRTTPHHGCSEASEGDIECDELLGYQVAILDDSGDIVWVCIEDEFIDESAPIEGYNFTGHSVDS